MIFFFFFFDPSTPEIVFRFIVFGGGPVIGWVGGGVGWVGGFFKGGWVGMGFGMVRDKCFW